MREFLRWLGWVLFLCGIGGAGLAVYYGLNGQIAGFQQGVSALAFSVILLAVGLLLIMSTKKSS